MSGFTGTSGAYSITSHPLDNRDYSIDWSALLQATETIASANWTVPAGLTAGATGISGNITTQWLSGGQVGVTYLVACTMTTNQGRVFTRSFRLVVASGI